MSRELLVQGEIESRGTYHTSELSLFSATLIQALRTRDRYISLVFFCGYHIEDDELADGQVMMKSLINQVLRQQTFDISLLHQYVDLEGIWRGDIRQLCALFELLVQQLARETTVVCLIDSIVYYETDEFEADMLEVLRCLLNLVRDGGLQPTFKVLITTPLETEQVRLEFGDDDSTFLSTASLPQTNLSYARRRA